MAVGNSLLPVADVDVSALPTAINRFEWSLCGSISFSRVFSLSVVLCVLKPASVGVSVAVGHVADAVPAAGLVLAHVCITVRPVVLTRAVK